MTIGEQIYDLRIQKGITQEKLAELLEVSRQSVSKWELGQAMPEVDKIIRMSELFEVSTDTILLRDRVTDENKNPLHLGSIYLVVKDFERSVDFYEKLLNITVDNRCRSGNKFVEFHFDGKCIALMNEQNLIGHCTDLDSPYKFVQNYWVEDLYAEHKRVMGLDIGAVTCIREAYPGYRYFHLTDPDNNILEITGGYNMSENICQSCGMPLQSGVYGKNADGSENLDYCKFCFPDGHFSRDESMEEMIESCIPFLIEDGECKTPEEAREKLSKLMPTLKRWAQQG